MPRVCSIGSDLRDLSVRCRPHAAVVGYDGALRLPEYTNLAVPKSIQATARAYPHVSFCVFKKAKCVIVAEPSFAIHADHLFSANTKHAGCRSDPEISVAIFGARANLAAAQYRIHDRISRESAAVPERDPFPTRGPDSA